MPTIENVKEVLDDTFEIWKQIVDFTYENYPSATEEWNFSSDKLGWSFRIKDNKRVLVYLLPRDKFFKIAFVFGQKATDQILEGNMADSIKEDLKAAKKYAEGRGIRIDVRNKTMLPDLQQLICIKIRS